MLSATKHLGPGVRSFAEFTLSGTNVLRMTHQEVDYSGSCMLGICWHLPALPTTLARLSLRAQASRKEEGCLYIFGSCLV